jgi:hypothetical protein
MPPERDFHSMELRAVNGSNSMIGLKFPERRFSRDGDLRQKS